MSTHEVMEESLDSPPVELKREIGLISGINFLLVTILGPAVFIAPGKILAECNSIGMVLVIWISCGIFSVLNCIPFVELSTVIPKSGSIYIYIISAFRNRHPFFGELPAFLYLWIANVIVNPGFTAVNVKLIANFGFEVLEFFTGDSIQDHETFIKYLIGTLSMVLVCIINCLSVKIYVKSQNLMTAAVMSCIFFTVGCGLYMYISGRSQTLNVNFEGTNWSVGHLSQAVYIALYSYDGGWCITGVTEELKNPARNVLNSIVISLSMIGCIYVLLNFTYLSVFTVEEMATSTTLFSDFAGRVFHQSDVAKAIAAAIVCVCITANTMTWLFYTSRLGFAGAREGHIVEILCCIHKTRKTPAPSIIFQVVVTLVFFYFGGDVTELIDMCSFFSWMSYGTTMLTFFIFRKTHPDAYRLFRVPRVIPAFVLLVSCYLVVASLLITSSTFLLMFLVYVALLVVLYYIFIFKKFRIEKYDILQKRLEEWLTLVPVKSHAQL